MGWFKKHKVLSVILGVVLLFIVIGAMSDTETTSTETGQQDTEEQSQQEEESKTAKIGEVARDGKFEFTVKGIECGKNTVGSGFSQEEAQGQYCLLSLDVENVGDRAQSLTASNLYLYDKQDREFSADSMATSATNNESTSFFLNEINPGNTISGKVAFDVSQDANIVRAKLHDSAFSGGVEVNLQ